MELRPCRTSRSVALLVGKAWSHEEVKMQLLVCVECTGDGQCSCLLMHSEESLDKASKSPIRQDFYSDTPLAQKAA